MNETLAIVVVLLVMVAGANLPFMTERVLGLFVWRARGAPAAKPFWLRLAEALVLYGLTLAVGFLLEGQFGNRFVQGWEFYAITLAVFLVCAYPGFVWRYLSRRRRDDALR
ncbi:DUF2818 family protein [Verticiella sediminum]|uniref:DUF2818 family protein n=1 Tax=Verticiella sediminum TaxID=1247510 RepID=A0A556AVS0_9BURK|nr:DUF2818 family protein [Verticiella sediminum]TSH97048.1 DUF2818 family protein [Verticiella sediminum]